MLVVVLKDSVELGLADQGVDRYHSLGSHPSFELFLSQSIDHGPVYGALNVLVELKVNLEHFVSSSRISFENWYCWFRLRNSFDIDFIEATSRVELASFLATNCFTWEEVVELALFLSLFLFLFLFCDWFLEVHQLAAFISSFAFGSSSN